MFQKSWLVIRDDKKRTFEVCGQESNTNYFSNQLHAMQRLGMNVSSQILPVGPRYSNRELIKVTGYAIEQGLYDRLVTEYQRLTRESIGPVDDEL